MSVPIPIHSVDDAFAPRDNNLVPRLLSVAPQLLHLNYVKRVQKLPLIELQLKSELSSALESFFLAFHDLRLLLLFKITVRLHGSIGLDHNMFIILLADREIWGWDGSPEGVHGERER